MQEELAPRFPTLADICKDSLVTTFNMFQSNYGVKPPEFNETLKLRMLCKINDEYKHVSKPSQNGIQNLEDFLEQQLSKVSQPGPSTFAPVLPPEVQAKKDKGGKPPMIGNTEEPKSEIAKLIDTLPKETADKLSKIPLKFLSVKQAEVAMNDIIRDEELSSTLRGGEVVSRTTIPQFHDEPGASRSQLAKFDEEKMGGVLSLKMQKLVKPTWHPPWKLMRVIVGHQGWVTCLDIDPANQFFVTGSKDRTIKIWDLATGQLKLTLTGHINSVRGLAISHKHTYMFSAGEDKAVKCWDLEYNKVIRHYHGHLSGVYALSLHPTLDLLATGGRDSVVRLWDIRTKAQVHVLSGHGHTISSIATQEFEPQLVSASHDSTLRLWDIGTGRCIETLTNHKKSVRDVIFHHEEYTFVSAGSDNMKVWKCPEGSFLRNISGHNSIINTLALNRDNVLVSGGDNGSLNFWDWKSGYNFQQLMSKPQSGSISSEAGIFAAKFDRSSMRLVTAECDKTIKIWKEDENATPDTHPIDPDFKVMFDDQRF